MYTPKALYRSLTAMKVAGRKNIVTPAIVFISLLSREVDIATLCEDLARLALVIAKRRLIAESRCAMPL